MTTKEEQELRISDAVRRFRRIKQPGTNDTVAAEAIDSALLVCDEDHSLGLLRLWHALRGIDTPLVARTLSFLLTRHPSPPAHIAFVVALDLMSQRDLNDTSTSLNLIKAIGDWFGFGGHSEPLLLFELPSFLSRVLKGDLVVQSAAIEAIASLAEAGHMAALPKDVVENLLLQVGSVTRNELLDADLEAISAAQTERHVDPTSFYNSIVRSMSEVDSRLREQSSPEIVEARNHLRSYLIEAHARAASNRLQLPVQVIRVANRSEFPEFGVVTSVINRWVQVFKEACRSLDRGVTLRPIETMHGSFVLNVSVDAGTGLANAFNQLVKLSKAGVEEIEGRNWAQFVDARLYQELLEVLAQQQATLEVFVVEPGVRMDSKAMASIFMKPLTARKMLPPVRKVGVSYLKSDQVPQADALDRVFEVVRLVHDGEAVTSESLNVAARQVNYYKQACRILGLLTEDGGLTHGGEQVAKLNGDRQRAFAAVLFENSNCGAAWIRWSDVATLVEVKPDTAEDFLRTVAPSLSATTASRRAQTLVAWQRELAQFHYTRLATTKNDVRSSADD